MTRRHAKNRILKRTFVVLWGIIFVFSLTQSIRLGSIKPLWLIPLPVLLTLGMWLTFYFLLLLHELGHVFVGFLLGFPVQGVELGFYPHRVFRIKRFSVHVGQFPRGGRTILGPGFRSYSKIRQFCFLSGGLVFELLFFVAVLHGLRGLVWLQLLVSIFYVDQIWSNLYPKFENRVAANDGALMLEILLPKRYFHGSVKAIKPLVGEW